MRYGCYFSRNGKEMIGMRSSLTLIPLLVLGGFIAIIAAIAAIIITESNKKKKQNELRLKMLMANDTKPSKNDDNSEEKQ